MENATVALIDIKSASVDLMIAEKGVNNTFVVKFDDSRDYDGYYDGKFEDVQTLQDAIVELVNAAKIDSRFRFREVYVGVPGEFIELFCKNHTISFLSKRKIGERDVAELFNGALTEKDSLTYVTCAPICFLTSDKRQCLDPTGLVSDYLEGTLSYYYCSDYFVNIISDILKRCGIKKFSLVPATLAQCVYLIDKSKGDEYAILLDVGKLSGTFAVVYESGLLYQNTFDLGRVDIRNFLASEIEVPQEVASEFLKKANLCVKRGYNGTVSVEVGNAFYQKTVHEINEAIVYALDKFCEVVQKCLDEYNNKYLDSRPVYLTGDGISSIKGVCDHMSKRLNRVVTIVSPNIPYYDKPDFSSKFSCLKAIFDGKMNFRQIKCVGGVK